MGIIVNEKVTFVSVDKETNKLVIKYKDDKQFIDGISGKLIAITRQQKTLDDGTELDKLVVELQDDQRYQLNFGFHSGASHNLINTFLGTLKIYNCNCKISSYKKDGFPKLFVEINNKRANWKFQPPEIPKVETIKLRSGKETKDDSLKQKFFEDAYLELLKKFELDKSAYFADEEAF